MRKNEKLTSFCNICGNISLDKLYIKFAEVEKKGKKDFEKQLLLEPTKQAYTLDRVLITHIWQMGVHLIERLGTQQCLKLFKLPFYAKAPKNIQTGTFAQQYCTQSAIEQPK